MCRAINCLMHAMRASTREDSTHSANQPTCVGVCVCVCMWASQPVAIFDNTFVFACGGASGAGAQQRAGLGRQWAVERLAHTFRYTEH